MPRVVASTVVRASAAGEPHGALYRVDLDQGTAERVLAWDEPIDLAPRGGDRGLRGIAVTDRGVHVATSTAVIHLDRTFREIGRSTCPALRHAHAVACLNTHLLVVSTGFDSLLSLDLRSGAFDWGVCVRGRDDDLGVVQFDPAQPPPSGSSAHWNQVAVVGTDVYLSGRRSPYLLRLRDGQLDLVDTLPLGTHDVTPTGEGGLVYHDSDRDRVVWRRPDGWSAVSVPRFPLGGLERLDAMDGVTARQAFARGLVWLGDGRVIGGSSPATVSLYDLAAGTIDRSVTLQRDVRHAVHAVALLD